MGEISKDIEKFWRDKFADELDDCIVPSLDDDQSRWFNEGIKYASMYLRYNFGDSSIDNEDL